MRPKKKSESGSSGGSERILTASDYAWAAGFIDGEGCFTDSKGVGPHLSVGQHHPEVLHKLQRILGGRVNGPYKSHHPNGSPRYRYQLSAGQVRHQIVLIWPHLGTVKKAQYLKWAGGDKKAPPLEL